MPMKPHDSGSVRPPSTFGERSSDMMQPVQWRKVKRSLVGILRGLHPGEADVVVETLIDSGLGFIEVPLNSSEPVVSVVGAVGGVSEKNLAAYMAVGIRALGLGSSLYRPGMTAPEVREAALTSVHAYDRLG